MHQDRRRPWAHAVLALVALLALLPVLASTAAADPTDTPLRTDPGQERCDTIASKEPDMKEAWIGRLLGALSLLATALTGRHGSAVAQMMLTALGMTYLTVCWLVSRRYTGGLKFGPFEWTRASCEDHAKPVAEALQPSRRRRWLRRKPPPDSP